MIHAVCQIVLDAYHKSRSTVYTLRHCQRLYLHHAPANSRAENKCFKTNDLRKKRRYYTKSEVSSKNQSKVQTPETNAPSNTRETLPNAHEFIIETITWGKHLQIHTPAPAVGRAIQVQAGVKESGSWFPIFSLPVPGTAGRSEDRGLPLQTNGIDPS